MGIEIIPMANIKMIEIAHAFVIPSFIIIGIIGEIIKYIIYAINRGIDILGISSNIINANKKDKKKKPS